MADQPENLVLKLLGDIRERLGSLNTQIGELRDGQQEIVGRLGAVEVGLAEQRVSVDRLRADIKRLERRFDAADAFGKPPS